MSTGSLSGGHCFETSQEATDNHFSAMIPFSYYDQTNNKLVTISYSQVAGVWQKNIDTVGVIVSTVAPVPAFPLCFSQSESFMAGTQYGVLVATAMVCAFAVMAIAKVLK